MNTNMADTRLNGTWKDYTTGHWFHFEIDFGGSSNKGSFRTNKFLGKDITCGTCYASEKSLLTLLIDNPDGTVDAVMAHYEILKKKLILDQLGGDITVYER